MVFKVLLVLIFKAIILSAHTGDKSSVINLTDSKWNEIQKGQWLVGFFDNETENSKQLEEMWNKFADLGLRHEMFVARIFAPENPGLTSRFLVTAFPKVFFVANGVTYEIPKMTNAELLNWMQVPKKYSELKPVLFMRNPFSIQMSFVHHIFVLAVNLFNFENSIVQKYVSSSPSATDVVYCMTFILVGLLMGLVFISAFKILLVILERLDPNESDEQIEKKEKKVKDKDETKEKISTEKSGSVRKRRSSFNGN